MKTRSYLQRHTKTESSEPAPFIKPRPFSDPTFDQPETTSTADFSQVDLFSHAPQRSPIQAKLTVGAPNDQYEQEADRVAAQVVNNIQSPQTQAGAGQPVQRSESAPEEEMQMKPAITAIQREEAPEAEDEEMQMKPEASTLQRAELPDDDELQMKPEAAAIQREELPDDDELQMKPEASAIQREELPEDEMQMKSMGQQLASGEAAPASDHLESQIQQARGNGQPLADPVRSDMEQAFGADFGGVRVHTDAQSDQMNRSVQAQAFTTGQDIFFRPGNYDPGSRGGQELLAHELTHVVQQSGGQVQQTQQEE
jgi:hypothetical protein